MLAEPASEVELCKTVVLGTAGVGKTCLVDRFIHGKFGSEQQECNLAYSFMAKSVNVGTKSIQFQLWDTCGQERFMNMTKSYYRGAGAGVVAYDITSRASFDDADQWLSSLQACSSAIAIALVGCKSDLEADREVDPESALAYAMDKGILFMETSAVSGHNVNELFDAMASRLQGPTRMFSLEIQAQMGCGTHPALIFVRNLAGDVVTTVEADLLVDDVCTVQTAVAKQTGVPQRHLALLVGATYLNECSGDAKLSTFFHTSDLGIVAQNSVSPTRCSIS